MLTHIWYVTKFIHISAAVSFVVGSTILVAPHFSPDLTVKPVRKVQEQREVRALPVTLPQGRLYCVNGVVMHERMYPRGMERISASDAVDVSARIADEACASSFRTAACKSAQADLTALRRAVRGCHA
jgi:hypothetical protein